MSTNTYINKGNKATRTGFGEGVARAAGINHHVIGLGADITSSVGMDLFRDQYPERFFSMGIAEQNCMGIAAGLALEGFVPVFSTYAVFAAFRAADQLRISVCYNNVHVIVGGAHAGISVGPDGATHQALEDISLVRTLPNITLLSPCDATQAAIATMAGINEIPGPVYIRFGREPVPDFTMPEQDFVAGKAQLMQQGTDLTIIATGHMVWEALQAALLLDKKGISARVLNIHTIKPIDKEAIIHSAIDTGCILTVEEHQIHGGLGSAVAEVICQHHPVPITIMGINDHFGESGEPQELLRKFGLDANNISKSALELLRKKHNT